MRILTIYAHFPQGNTFQVVLATNGSMTYGLFSFPSNGMPFLRGASQACPQSGLKEDQMLAIIAISFIDEDNPRAAVGSTLLSIREEEVKDLLLLQTSTNCRTVGQYVISMTGETLIEMYIAY